MSAADYSYNRIIVLDFVDKLYGDGTSVGDFTPKALKLVREEMINSRRFCRNILNRYVKGVVAIFAFGVEHELVQETTWRALKAVKSLPKGHPGTFDHEERQPVPDDVVRRTLPFMSPTLRAMVQLQRMLGMRPNEIFKMRVGDIDTTRGNGLWYYVPGSYKTSQFVGKIVFPLGKPEQELIAPYLEGKKPEDAVFSPRTAVKEQAKVARSERKTPMTPSQRERDKARAKNPQRKLNEFYDHSSYRHAVWHAIKKVNKDLPDGEKVPHWTPYQLRHFAATALKKNKDAGRILAQAALAHTSPETTDIYIDDTDEQLIIREILAMERKNPFASTE
jgi:integrase